MYDSYKNMVIVFIILWSGTYIKYGKSVAPISPFIMYIWVRHSPLLHRRSFNVIPSIVVFAGNTGRC